jgi:hypothetical protein
MPSDCSDQHEPHADTCEAEADHPHDCATASELARLRAFAEAVRDEVACSGPDLRADHVDDCLHCAAVQALERAR